MSRKSQPRHPGRTTFSIHRFPSVGNPERAPSREVVGSKAFGLIAMSRHGLPVPPGFVLGTELCRAFMKRGPAALEGLESALEQELELLGASTGRRFGDGKRPLLVSVRSGAAVSMPGMMETVLNLGLSEPVVAGLVRTTGNPRLAQDCRRRLIQQFAEVVHGVPPGVFEALVAELLKVEGLAGPQELDSEALADLARLSLEQFETATGEAFPDDPMRQLLAAIGAVLTSWSSERAASYRRLNGISDDAGTAAIVQAMVFGNSGPASGSGVGFTRSPGDGADVLYVDYLPNAQGEDVVAGRRNVLGAGELALRAPAAYADLLAMKSRLEQAFGDMQDFEFTVEDGRLYILQCRPGKRTPLAALKIAHDLVGEGLITPARGLELLAGVDLDRIEIEQLDECGAGEPMARAVPASAGVAVGLAVFDPARIERLKAGGRPLILLREFAETVDFDAVAAAAGLVTTFGARTSHAAVVARQMGKVCLVGCDSLRIDVSGRCCRFGDTVIKEGEALSIDGGSGLIYRGELAARRHRPTELIASARSWCKD